MFQLVRSRLQSSQRFCTLYSSKTCYDAICHSLSFTMFTAFGCGFTSCRLANQAGPKTMTKRGAAASSPALNGHGQSEGWKFRGLWWGAAPPSKSWNPYSNGTLPKTSQPAPRRSNTCWPRRRLCWGAQQEPTYRSILPRLLRNPQNPWRRQLSGLWTFVSSPADCWR